MSGRNSAGTRRLLPRLLAWLGIAVAVVFVVLALQTAFAAFWVWRDAAALERSIADARSAVTAGRFDDAAQHVDTIAATATSLADQTSQSTWWRGQHLPFVGTTFTAVHTMSTSTAEVAAAAQAVFARIREAGSTGAAIASLSTAAGDLGALDAALHSASTAVEALPDSGLLLGVDHAARRAKETLPELIRAADVATEAAAILPELMGTEAPQQWLVMLQNTAESRGSGGNFSAFALVEFVDGKPRIVEAASRKSALDGQTIPYLTAVDPSTASLYGKALGDWASFNLSADFPSVARLAAAGMKARGTPVDGVLAIDPVTVGSVLAGTGPVEHKGVTIDDTSAADFFTKGIYDKYPRIADVDAKDELTTGLLYATADSLFSRPLAVQPLWQGLSEAVSDGRVKAWSADPQAEEWLQKHSVGGQVDAQEGPDVVLALNNATGGKIDAYVTGDARYEFAQCRLPDQSGLVQSSVTVNLSNDAPDRLPEYVDLRLDDPTAPSGSTKVFVSVYGPKGARASRVTLDGADLYPRESSDAGRPVWVVPVELARGQSRSITLVLNEQRPATLDATGPDLKISSPAGGIDTRATDDGAREECVLSAAL